MNKPIHKFLFEDPEALAELLYAKSKDIEKEEDHIERAKKEVELLKIGRQIREHSATEKKGA